MKNKLDEHKKKLDMKDSTIFFISAKNLRLKIRLRSIREKLPEYARHGSMKAVCYNLQKAADSGLLENKNTLKGMLETVARNFHVEKNGKRYQAPFKLFLEVLLLWGGPRIANFVALNLGGPEIHSIYWWRNQHRIVFAGGIEEVNFKKLASIYKEAMARITPTSVPMLAAEDETGIIGQIVFNQASDELLGFCGVKGLEHKCLDYFTVVVGNGEEGYNSIVNAFDQYKVGTYGRAILLFSQCQPAISMVALENVWLLELMNVQGLLYLMTMRCWTGPIRLSSLEIFLAWCTLEITAGKNISVLFPTQTPKRSPLPVTSRFMINSR